MKISYIICDGCRKEEYDRKGVKTTEVKLPQVALDLCQRCVGIILQQLETGEITGKKTTEKKVIKKKPSTKRVALPKQKKRKKKSALQNKKRSTADFIKDLKKEVGLSDSEIVDREEILREHDKIAKRSRRETSGKDHVKEILDKFSK